MSTVSQTRTIDKLTEKASKAVARGHFFEARRLAGEALDLARDEGDFERMARIAPVLREAQRQHIDAALDTGAMTVLDTPFTDEVGIEPGCFLIRPPLVGADARRLRLLAFSRRTPVAVLCREPLARIGLCPVVAIGGGITVRAKVDPPLDPDRPDIDWFLDALDALGEAALETIDPEMDVVKRVDALLDRLDAVPEYDGLHVCLEDTCREAHEALAAEQHETPPTEAEP
jgi:hypothetical protein